VDRVGVLAHLYTIGDVAYVGGGFHDMGLHSVLEPAAARLPVTFGPRHRNARAAAELIDCGGAAPVEDSDDLAALLVAWLQDEKSGSYAGGCGFGYIERHLGAADRTGALLADLFPHPSPKGGT
jgi:3-deoxy-D-manno-octulosonic-acid transferase